jgi:DNA-binding YbaB/EbfC family protein
LVIEGQLRRAFQLQITNRKLQGSLMSGFNLQELMSQAKQQYETLQKKMEQTTVEASAGGGTVTVKMDGRKQVVAIKIDPEAIKDGDVEMLQDLMMAAVNEAGRKVDQAMQSSVGGMLGGMGLNL